MKELIEYIARSLASNPDAVVVTEEVAEGRVVFRLEVAPEDKIPLTFLFHFGYIIFNRGALD